MSTNEPVIASYAQAPARTITAGGVTYAYRELGPKGAIARVVGPRGPASAFSVAR